MKLLILAILSLVLVAHASTIEDPDTMPQFWRQTSNVLTDKEVEDTVGGMKPKAVKKMAAGSTRLSKRSISRGDIELAKEVCMTLRRTASALGQLGLKAGDSPFGGFIRRIRIIIIWWDWIIIIIIRRFR